MQQSYKDWKVTYGKQIGKQRKKKERGYEEGRREGGGKKTYLSGSRFPDTIFLPCISSLFKCRIISPVVPHAHSEKVFLRDICGKQVPYRREDIK